MSNWKVNFVVDVSRLTEISRKLGAVPAMLEDVAEQTAAIVKDNIRAKDIIDTGALLDSITSESMSGGAKVRDGVSYGVYNEFGTYKMAERPFFVPALQKFGEIISKEFIELMR